MNNEIHVITPYWYGTSLVFDDPSVDLVREAFVGGADVIIDRIAGPYLDADNGLTLTFSSNPFPGHEHAFQWVRFESGGNVYRSADLDLEGWLCPALLRYFDTPPEAIYVKTGPRGNAGHQRSQEGARLQSGTGPDQGVELLCILDRSSSMEIVRDEAIRGFNQFLDEQRRADPAGYLSLVLFDRVHDVVYRRWPLMTAKSLDRSTYVPRGTTALLDALGVTLEAAMREWLALPVADRPRVVVAILTDGEENTSRHYSWETVQALIANGESHGWKFVFLAANQDAVASGARLSIRREDSHAFLPDAAGVKFAFSKMSEAVIEKRMSPRD